MADIVFQGEVWWADLADPPGSTAGYRRPIVILQGDAVNRSRIATVICVPLTSAIKWASAPGNLLLPATATGLDRDSVAQISLVLAVDKTCLTDRVGKVSQRQLTQMLSGLDVVLGRTGPT